MVALAIIYNHRYDKNIPKLDEIYKDRFSHMFHIMPFYDGDKDNVIPVYEHSFYFQGYIAQASKILKAKGDFDHFIFVGDDVLLHPDLNENNYKDFFRIGDDGSFITYIRDLVETGNTSDLFIMHLAQFFKIADKPGTGLEITKELPSYDEAVELLQKKGYEEPYMLPKHVYPFPKRTDFKKTIFGEYFYRRRLKEVKELRKQDKIKLNYPLVNGFSDLLIIPNQDFDKFAHYCGVFASARLFVEYAVPTIMLMVCKKIVTEADLDKKSLLLWNEDREKFEKEYDASFQRIFSNFPENALYIHPIKLSKWKL